MVTRAGGIAGPGSLGESPIRPGLDSEGLDSEEAA